MKTFLKNEIGVTAIEYALIAAAMGGALISVSPTLLAAVKAKFTVIKGYFS